MDKETAFQRAADYRKAGVRAIARCVDSNWTDRSRTQGGAWEVALRHEGSRQYLSETHNDVRDLRERMQ